MNENAALRGRELIDGLHKLKAGHSLIGDVRGKGLMAAIELVEDRVTKKPLDKKRMAVVADAAFEAGVMLRVSSNNIILSPPLIIAASEVTAIVRAIDAGLAAAANAA